MAFWSGERLAIELPNLIYPYDPQSIDCASYRLRVGGQAFVTSDHFSTSAPSAPIISVFQPAPNHTLQIPPGQFAFLLTDEKVAVPHNAIALISIRAKHKFKGLINVSGFHVDPGWNGQLIFSIYNAGPNPVIIEDKQDMFLIVYADLDQATTKVYTGIANGRARIEPHLVEGMNSQVFSPQMLQREMEALKSELGNIKASESNFRAVTYGVSASLTLLITLAALFATFAPQTLGVILAKVIESAGYEMKSKPNDSPTPLAAISASSANSPTQATEIAATQTINSASMPTNVKPGGQHPKFRSHQTHSASGSNSHTKN